MLILGIDIKMAGHASIKSQTAIPLFPVVLDFVIAVGIVQIRFNAPEIGEPIGAADGRLPYIVFVQPFIDIPAQTYAKGGINGVLSAKTVVQSQAVVAFS